MHAIQIPCYANLKPILFKLSSPVPKSSISFGYSSDFFHKYGKNRRCCNLVTRAAATKDHYSTLNVDKNSSLQEIKSSYRKLARKYHPDLNKGPGAEDKFKEISAAYEVLSDDEKRSLYDRFGEAGLQGEFDGSSSGSHGMDPFDIYNAFFGDSDGFFGGMGEAGGINFNLRNTGKDLDIRYDLYVSFEESIFGGQQEIEFSRFETCDSCGGTGAKSNSSIKSCTDCGGRGGVMKTQRTPFGMMSQVSTCSKCNGDGKLIAEHCQKCGGNGSVSSKRSMKVVIPPGIYNGALMQIRGEGNADKKRGTAGDLYITLHINEKRGIWRDGHNLYSKISVDYTQAILGTVVKVETVDGLKDLYIPSGIQHGDTVKLSQMGVPDIKKPFVRGDHLFIVNVLIPKDISDKERALVEELASLTSYSKHHEAPTNSSGTFKSENRAGNARTKSVASLWSSIRDFLGRRQSREGFASITVDTSGLLWKSRKPDFSFTCSLTAVFIVTYILTIMRKIDKYTLSQGRNSNPQYMQNMKR